MENQLAELVAEPSGQFNNFTRMSLSDFEYLLQKVSPMISKTNTLKREAIPAKIRLAITLRFLASGDSFESLHYLFKVSGSIISRIVPEVCIALNQVLKDLIRVSKNKIITKLFIKKEHSFGKIGYGQNCSKEVGTYKTMLHKTPDLQCRYCALSLLLD